MNDEFEKLLRAGVWLGPAVLGSLCCRLLADGTVSTNDLPGIVALLTAAVLLTAAGIRFTGGKNAVIAPAVFAAMFVATLSMR
jgi:hypothetical protein